MDRNHVLGMISGYYLSRFDSAAYSRLGFGNKRSTHRELGRLLRVPEESVRNWRDEFDPVHDNPRRGWHKREMRVSRLRTVDVLGQLADDELHELIRAAIASPSGPEASHLVALLGDLEAAG